MSNLSNSDGLPVRVSGEWARRKHHYLNNYCGITTVSMRDKFKLVYLDVMAGPGRCKIEETGEEFPGSPLVALEHDFSEYIFIEEEPALADALKQRVAKHPKLDKIKIIPQNWIDVAESSRRLKFDDSTLVVAFIDPTGISQVPLSAMRRLAANPRIDLLVTIQYRLGIVWNAPQYRKARGSHTALDEFLGERTWRDWTTKDPSEFGPAVGRIFLRQISARGTLHWHAPCFHPGKQSALSLYTVQPQRPRQRFLEQNIENQRNRAATVAVKIIRLGQHLSYRL